MNPIAEPGSQPGHRRLQQYRQPAVGGRRFSFVLISDRTGSARPGVFEQGLAVTDLLAPDFAIQLGDLIEGYTQDLAEIEQQWLHVDGLLADLVTPVRLVPGNHDVANTLQRKVWGERYGPTYQCFRYLDTLFCLLDTQDPPDEYAEQRDGWDTTQPASLHPDQLDFVEAALAEHHDVRWTFLCMHMPLWQGTHPAWTRLRRNLGSRPYTAFAGHVHNYRHDRSTGRSHIRLGPTGGGWVLPDHAGNFDHVTQVTMTVNGPTVANVLVGGVRDINGDTMSGRGLGTTLHQAPADDPWLRR